MTGDRIIRASAAAVVVGIGAVAAFVSYRHALDVATAHGETGATARLLPLTVDGLVYVASMVLLDAARRGQRAPGLARWALALGIGATVAVNVLHGIAHGPIGAVIAAWPAVCLVVTVELLMGSIRRGAGAAELRNEAAEYCPLGGEIPHLDSAPVAGAAVQAYVTSERQKVPPRGQNLTAEFDTPAAELVRVPAVPAAHLARAREVFAETLAAGAVPSVRAIKATLRVGQPRARQVRAYLSEYVAETGT